MKKSIFAILFALSLCASAAHAQCTLSSGATVSQMQAATNQATAGTCPGPLTHQLNYGAGSYAITSPITVSCPTAATIIQGPVTTYRAPTSLLPSSYAYSTPYTANLNGTLASGLGWSVGSSTCTSPITIQGFNWNGGQPSGGGGGWINVVAGTSNLTIQNNYIHGNWASTTTGHSYDSLIYLAGTGTQTPIDSNVRIVWNVFGNGSSDCNPIMNLTSYQGGSYAQFGGNCSAVGVQVSTTNLVLQNNSVEHVEQGFKFFSGGGQNDITHTQMLNNSLVDSNDFGQVHRIPVEGQMMVVSGNSTGGVMTVTNNSLHDAANPNFGNFGLSLPMCCSSFNGYTTNDNQNNPSNNVMIANGASSGYIPGALEWWSTGISNNNLYQGWWGLTGAGALQAGVVQWGFTNTAVRTWSSSNNIFQFASANAVAYQKEETNTVGPTLSGNTTSTTISARASVAPTISPAAGAQTFPLAVTLTDPGYTSGTGPQGNTGIWYTTDGSTPVPGAGTALRVDSGTAIVLASAATVKAVGMWGALNQPPAYPTGYGFVPSSVVSSAFTGGGAATLTGMTLSGTQALLAPGGVTSQLTANGTYSNSTSGSVTPSTWVSSNPSIATVSSSGLVTPVAVGTTNITATLSSVTSSPALPITVTAPAITGGHLSTTPTNGINSMAVGGTQQFQAIATYANGATGPVTATACTWSSANSAVLTVNSAGLVTAVGGGTANVQVSCSGVIFSPWGVNVAAATLSSTSLSTTPTSGITTVTVGATAQLATTGTFSDGSSTIVSPTSYTSSTTSICTVTGVGLVTGVSAGACSITSLTGSTTSSAYTPTITAATLVSMSLSGPSSIINVGTTQLLGATGTYSDASSHSINPASWVSLQLPICTVDASGNVTAVAVGSCTITAVQDTVTSSGFSITVQPAPPPSAFSVLNVGPVISVSIIGEPIQLSAVGVSPTGMFGTPPGVAWVSSNTSVATVDANGLVTLVGIGTAQITVTLGSLTSSAASIVSLPTFANATYQYSPCCSLLYGLSVGTHTLTVNANGSVTIN